MRMRANICGTGITRHLVWDAKAAAAVPIASPVTAEIVEEGDAVFLLRLSEGGDCVADTWHENIAAAKEQAAFEYGIADEDWVAVV